MLPSIIPMVVDFTSSFTFSSLKSCNNIGSSFCLFLLQVIKCGIEDPQSVMSTNAPKAISFTGKTDT